MSYRRQRTAQEIRASLAEIVVLGGGMSNLPTLAEDVQRALPPHVFSDQVATRVLRNVHGDSSGVRGAAWLWPVEDEGAVQFNL